MKLMQRTGVTFSLAAVALTSALVARAAEPAAAKPAAVATRPTTGPAESPAEHKARVQTAIDRGVEFLKKSQNKDGSWGTGTETRGFEVYSMVPGSHDAFRVATTALCVMALREAGEKEAHDKGVEYLVTKGEARRDDGPLLYNTWAHTYAVQALAQEMMAKSPGASAPDPRLKTAIEKHLKFLTRYETYMGGWNYYDFDAQTQVPSMGPTSFGTAAALVALWEAKQAGVDVPQKTVDRSIKRLVEMKVPGGGAYLYSHDLKFNPRMSANRVRGSVGRTQACNYALWLWGAGKVDETVVRTDLEMFFKEHNFIQMGRKRQFPHESWYQTAPYYYYFGHYYTGRLIEKLGDQGRKDFGAKLADVGILPYQDKDGAWWDFAMWNYHKPYGTAFAVMTLLRCE
jgi:hypothetical protein